MAESLADTLVSCIIYIAEARKLSLDELLSALLRSVPDPKKREEFEMMCVEELLEQGRKKGQIEGAAGILLRRLGWRFGRLSSRSQKRIRALSLAQLERLDDAIFYFQSPRDLSAWLNQQAV